MIPVDQSIMHDPDNKRYGDCWRACVASVLELSLENVPHFAGNGGENSFDPTKDYLRFMAKHGFLVMSIHMPVGKNGLVSHPVPVEDEHPYYFIIGKSPRCKDDHVCVGYQQGLLHDPHPGKTGLDSISVFEILFKI